MIHTQPVGAFLDDLAAATPTPGGGSAAALAGASGAALVSMMCNLTIGRQKFAGVEAEMKELLAQSEVLRLELTALITQDMETFNRLMIAYRLPSETEAEKSVRRAAIQEGAKAATLISLTTAEACVRVIDLGYQAAGRGNPNVVGDAGVGLICAQAGLKGAALNVLLNLEIIEDKGFVTGQRARLTEFLSGHEALAGEVYALAQGDFQPEQ